MASELWPQSYCFRVVESDKYGGEGSEPSINPAWVSKRSSFLLSYSVDSSFHDQQQGMDFFVRCLFSMVRSVFGLATPVDSFWQCPGIQTQIGTHAMGAGKAAESYCIQPLAREAGITNAVEAF